MDPIRIGLRLFFFIPMWCVFYFSFLMTLFVVMYTLEEFKEGLGMSVFEVMMDVVTFPFLFFLAIFSARYSERFNKALFSLIEKTYTPGCF